MLFWFFVWKYKMYFSQEHKPLIYHVYQWSQLKLIVWHFRYLKLCQQIFTFKALLRNLLFKFMRCLVGLADSVIVGLSNPMMSCSHYSSRLRVHWLKCLYVNAFMFFCSAFFFLSCILLHFYWPESANKDLIDFLWKACWTPWSKTKAERKQKTHF